MAESLEQVFAKLKKQFASSILDVNREGFEMSVGVERSRIVDVLAYLRDQKDLAFKQLTDLCGVDYLDREERFEVVYHLLSYKYNLRLRLKVCVDEDSFVPSVSKVYSAANWYEREAWDLYGVKFEGHEDLRRILTDYDFDGHPLRKDFPLTGYVEPRYDDEQKRVVYNPVKLPQEFRNFDFLSPWEGMTHDLMVPLPGDEKANDPKKTA
jgi:NADH-quinone oxidoreductase subunit C